MTGTIYGQQPVSIQEVSLDKNVVRVCLNCGRVLKRGMGKEPHTHCFCVRVGFYPYTELHCANDGCEEVLLGEKGQLEQQLPAKAAD